MIVFTRICHCKILKPAKSNIHTSYFFSVHFNIILRSTPIFPHTTFLPRFEKYFEPYRSSWVVLKTGSVCFLS